jgi:hypothetical protein
MRAPVELAVPGDESSTPGYHPDNGHRIPGSPTNPSGLPRPDSTQSVISHAHIVFWQVSARGTACRNGGAEGI